jgi:hypothetical protein
MTNMTKMINKNVLKAKIRHMFFVVRRIFTHSSTVKVTLEKVISLMAGGVRTGLV